MDSITKYGEVFVAVLEETGAMLVSTYTSKGRSRYAALFADAGEDQQVVTPLAALDVLSTRGASHSYLYPVLDRIFCWPFVDSEGEPPTVEESRDITTEIYHNWPTDDDCTAAAAEILFRLLFLSVGDYNYPTPTRAASTATSVKAAETQSELIEM